MIADTCEVLKAKALPPALWSQAVRHAVWIKNCTLTQSLNSKITPYQSYFGKPPSLATLHLFGCKAFAHVPKTDQTKLGECSIECVHIGFAEEKRAYILYNHEQCMQEKMSYGSKSTCMSWPNEKDQRNKQGPV